MKNRERVVGVEVLVGGAMSSIWRGEGNVEDIVGWACVVHGEGKGVLRSMVEGQWEVH